MKYGYSKNTYERKNSAKTSSVIYLCCSLCLLVTAVCSPSSPAYPCAGPSGMRALQGHGRISAQCCQSPELLYSQECHLVTPDITGKNSTEKRHSRLSSVALRSWICPEVKCTNMPLALRVCKAGERRESRPPNIIPSFAPPKMNCVKESLVQSKLQMFSWR